MAEKKKKTEVNDFEMPNAEDIDLLKQERAGSAARVAQFNKDFVPTGSAFKDTGVMSGTSRDVKRTREIDALFSKAADRQATTRGQDMDFTSNAGTIAMNQDRTRVMEKQGDQQFQLGEGELAFNKGIFDATQDRYNKIGVHSDKLNLAKLSAEVTGGFADIGLDPSENIKSITEQYGSVAKPTPAIIGEPSIQYNEVPPAKTRMDAIGDVFSEGTGIGNPYDLVNRAIKTGKKTGKKIRSYLTGSPDMSTIRRRVNN